MKLSQENTLGVSRASWLRLSQILLIVVVGSLVGSCSTVSKKQATLSYPLPPQENGEGGKATEPARNLALYRQAKLLALTEPAKACSIWVGLSAQSVFPLSRLSRLRALENCPIDQEKETLALDRVMQTQSEPWLSEEFSRAALARAVKTGDRKWEAKLSYEVAKFEPVQLKQIALLERTLLLAGQAGDQPLVEQATKTLYQVAPRKIPEPTPAQFLNVAFDFRRAREFDKAREYFDRVLSAKEFSENDKYRALDGVRMSYKLQKNTAKYLQATEDYANFARAKFLEKARRSGRAADYGRFLEAQITLARAVWTENSPRKAEEILIEAEKEMRGKGSNADSAFIRARIAEERGDYTQAVKIFETMDPNRIGRDRIFRMKIAWYRAWSLRKIGRLKEAAEALDQLVKDEATSPSSMSRDRFWLARTYKEMGEKDRAVAEFESLIETDPIGYYGVLAYRELGRKLPPLPVGVQVKTSSDAVDPLAPEERLKFEWLLAVREDDVANQLLNTIGLNRRSGYKQDQSFELLRSYARTGSYNALFSRTTDLPAEARKALVQTEPELIFPMRWKPLAEAAGNKYDVKPELVFSIIRQESSFNPQARSHADAFGLMQLIPEMAKRAEAVTGIQLKAHEDLYQPEINIPLGTSFLRTTLDRWQGAFIPTVASYNASERAVSGWLNTRDTKDPVAFIEDVPYEETRTYLKLVMRNFVFYSRLNPRQVAIDFPEWCLQDLQAVKP
jgi:soluble lytic murein transglycosylase